MSSIRTIGFALLFIGVVGCGPGEMYLAPTSTVQTDSLQITDARIREAFNLRPQLTKPLNVALYTSGSARTGLADSLRGLDGVASVYAIPPSLVEAGYYGYSRYEWGPYRNPRGLDLAKLRLLAAQGQADVLVYFGATHQYDQDPNWLAPTYALLVTALFVPGHHASLRTDVDAFFIDVRNGFLYASHHDWTTTENRYVRLFYQSHVDDIAAEHVEGLLPGVVDAARTAFSTERFYRETASE